MVNLEISDQIAVITLADCPALSRHDEQAGRVLRDALLSCDDRDDVKAVVLRSASAHFCEPLAPPPPVTQYPARWSEIYAGSTGLYQSLCFSKKVTITAVAGTCADAGSALVLCSDLTVADPAATFSSPFHVLPEANFVLAALTMRLNRVKSWMLGGAPLDAASALKAGLVNRIAQRNCTAEALDLARSVVRMPLDAIAMSKVMFETCLDAQGTGQDFDMADFNAALLSGIQPSESRR